MNIFRDLEYLVDNLTKTFPDYNIAYTLGGANNRENDIIHIRMIRQNLHDYDCITIANLKEEIYSVSSLYNDAKLESAEDVVEYMKKIYL